MRKLPPGAQLLEDFVSEEEETRLMAAIDELEWAPLFGNAPSRRVIQLGRRFNYATKLLEEGDAMPMPESLEWILERVAGCLKSPVQQVIINEYVRRKKHAIKPHVDRKDLFGPVITSLSLGSRCVMDFSCGDERLSVRLPRRSLLVLEGDARNHWRHGIAKTNSAPQGRRVSLTCRTLLE